jgi:CRISPR-associated exonuclease Cas4
MSAASSESRREETEPIALSALQHYLFCPRQCALIHVEQAWAENRSTAEGRLFHERVHKEGTQLRDGILTARGLRLASRRLGLAGVADAVEFHRLPGVSAEGVCLATRSGRWQPYPVEYKKGRMKKGDSDAVQLCAQALCLEEMLTASIPGGALFYGKNRRRKEVVFDAAIRQRTEETTLSVHEMLLAGITPPPVFDRRCRDCSLREICQPEETATKKNRVAAYLRRERKRVLSDAGCEDAS